MEKTLIFSMVWEKIQLDLEKLSMYVKEEHVLYKSYLYNYIEKCLKVLDDKENKNRLSLTGGLYDDFSTNKIISRVITRLIKLNLIKKRKYWMFEMLNIKTNNY